MKVKELIEALQKQDPEAGVGVSFSLRCGYVQDVLGLMVAPDGTVCVDQAENLVLDDEVELEPA